MSSPTQDNIPAEDEGAAAEWAPPLLEWPLSSGFDQDMDEDIQRYIMKSETFQFVEDYLAYMMEARGYQWEQPAKREGLTKYFNSESGRALLKLADYFRPMFREKFRNIGELMMSSKSDLQVYMWTFGKRLFGNGFNWDKMAAFLVFCSELGAFCMDNGKPELVDVTDSTMSSYILVKHFRDIVNQGCWLGFLKHCEEMVVLDDEERGEPEGESAQ